MLSQVSRLLRCLAPKSVCITAFAHLLNGDLSKSALIMRCTDDRCRLRGGQSRVSSTTTHTIDYRVETGSSSDILVLLRSTIYLRNLQTTGGLYFWSAKLAGPRFGPFASWITGCFNLLGQVAVTAGKAFNSEKGIKMLLLTGFLDIA
jgi:hypothetical protein